MSQYMTNQRNMNNMNRNNKSGASTRVSFAALDKWIEDNIILPVEKVIPGKGYVQWGERNRYPDYIYTLYGEVPTLQSIIDGNIDYIAGDNITILRVGDNPEGIMNAAGDTVEEQVRDIAGDYELFGGFALQVIRNMGGGIAGISYIDMRYLRTNEECTVFWYSEEWNKGGVGKAIRYPVFIPDLEWAALDEKARTEHASSILLVKRIHRQTYPRPLFASAIKACEIERCIDTYHLNAINNGFYGSMVVNFNNGLPEDRIKEEIEKDFNDKFAGQENAGRIMFSWNRNRESRTELITPQIQDYGERYNSLATRARQQIFTSFRANPNLFGIPTDNKGFSNEEYVESFQLYNRTQIRPVQKMICDAYDKILGGKGVMTITPFSLGQTESNGVG